MVTATNGSVDKLYEKQATASCSRADVYRQQLQDLVGSNALKTPKSSAGVVKSVLEANKQQTEVRPRDILQFSSAEYYVMEGEGFIEVQVDRLGRGKDTATVEYTTQDGSALAGVKYAAQQGTLVFGPDATEQRILIKILEDESFDSVLEFGIRLSNPQNAVLDYYLHKCEVTIVDDDVFPTNKFRDQIRQGNAAEVRPHFMLVEFFKMNWRAKNIRVAFIKTALSDQIVNLKHVLHILLTSYLIDEVLAPRNGGAPPDDAFNRVVIVAVIGIMPHPIQWFFNQMEANRRVAGKAIAPLQANLMRKFLNYSETSRKIVATSDLQMSVTRDIPDLVLDGFTMIFPILQQVGLLCMLGILAVQRSTKINRWLNLSFFFAYPVLMILFLVLREHGTVQRRSRYIHAQTELCAYVTKVTEFFRLISSYCQKHATVQKFTGKVKETNGAATAFLKWSNTNKQFAPFLTDVVCMVYIITSANAVIDGGPVGELVAGVSMFRGIGQCYQGIYANMLTMQEAIAPLQNVVHYMNLPIDLVERMAAHRVLLEELDKAQRASQGLLYSGTPHECSLVQNTTLIKSGDIVEKALYAQDLIQIDCRDVSFAYGITGGVKVVLNCASFEIAQGQLVVVIGPRGSGKSTLLKLMAGVLVPSPGSGLFFMPPHLKVGHVTQYPEIMHDESFLENLCFGPSDGVDEDVGRVVSIMNRLSINSDVIRAVRSSVVHKHSASQQFVEINELNRGKRKTIRGKGGTSSSMVQREVVEARADTDTRMSHTDRCLVHLARGLVMNPDVLILHKPLTNFDKVQAGRVLEVLREYVDMRGVEKPLEERVMRRPRTCIFSASSLEGINFADLVLQVEDNTVQEVDMDVLRAMEARAHQLFASMDLDRNGVISKSEFCTAVLAGSADKEWFFRFFGCETARLAGKSSEEVQVVLDAAYDQLDNSGSGDVSFDEMLHFMRHQMQRKQMPTHHHSLVKPGTFAKSQSYVEREPTSGLAWEIPEVSLEGRLTQMGEIPLSAGRQSKCAADYC